MEQFNQVVAVINSREVRRGDKLYFNGGSCGDYIIVDSYDSESGLVWEKNRTGCVPLSSCYFVNA